LGFIPNHKGDQIQDFYRSLKGDHLGPQISCSKVPAGGRDRSGTSILGNYFQRWGAAKQTPSKIQGQKEAEKWRQICPAISSTFLWIRDPLQRKPGLLRKYQKGKTRERIPLSDEVGVKP
jgi:hypothetical protein